MTTQQDRKDRETVRRTSRHRKTGQPEDHRLDAAAESSATKHRRFAGGAPAAQQGPSDAYSEGPSLSSRLREAPPDPGELRAAIWRTSGD